MFDKDLYFEEFIRYHDLASTQQAECNLGNVPHLEGTITDPLMQRVELYDVVERKFAGFTQVLLDLWYGDTLEHPYAEKLHDVRKPIAQRFTGVHGYWSLREWLFVFILHRVTGSGINYAKKPSGYNNTILPLLDGPKNLTTLVERASELLSDPSVPAYTSVGYQFPRFPKKTSGFRRGGDRFITEFAPRLACDLADFLTSGGGKRTLRETGEWMFEWNRQNGLSAYRFQYSAVLADIADFYPDLIDRTSMFLYGSNAVECISYMTGGVKSIDALDEVMDRAALITGNVPYNLEDVACDMIRWIEHYVRPGHDYDHVCRDTVWGTTAITTHPFGRQRRMLELGLIDSFNNLDVHPSDDYVLRKAGWTVEDYFLVV